MAPSRTPIIALMLTVSTMLFIVIAVLLPVNFMTTLLAPLNAMLYSVFPGAQVSAGKLGHTVAFFLLTWCAIRVSGFRTSRLIMLLMLIMLFSVMTELSQLLVEGRNPKLADLVFDLIGVMAALLIFYFPRFLALRKT